MDGLSWSNGIFGVARFEFRVAGQERKQGKWATRNPQHVTSKVDKRIIL
jgi:hypothetical protein